MKEPYRTSPVRRRSPDEMEILLGAIQAVIDEEEGTMTIRHLFYRLVGLEVIEKTERAYKTLCGHLAKRRRSEAIPWDAFADSTRWHIAPPVFDNPEDAWKRTVAGYRRDLWATQDYYIEVWIEKDAIAGVIADVTRSFGVPLFVCRGFASLSSMHSASLTFKEVQENNKAVVIYHLGDYDPSGHLAADAIERTFDDDFEVGINFERVAILPEHIAEFDLPTRPVKESTHARSWKGGECVELDSMRPADLRQLVEGAITSRIDPHAWEKLKETERLEREAMEATDLTKLLKLDGKKARKRKS
jgi:hypothetical protein